MANRLSIVQLITYLENLPEGLLRHPMGPVNNISPIRQVIEYVKDKVILKQGDLQPAIEIQRHSDIRNLEYFHFVDNNLNIEQFKNIIENCSCVLQIGGKFVCKYDFKILIELNPIQHVKNTFIIKIPNYLVKDIIMVALWRHIVELNFNLTHEFQEISVICKNIHPDEKEREILLSTNHEILIQQLDKGVYIAENTLGLKRLKYEITRLCGAQVTKGFFMFGKLDNIKKITFMLSGHDMFKYDFTMLKNIAHVVSENMFYISFEGSNNFANMDKESYIGSCVLMTNENIRIIFELFEPTESNYELYWLSANVLNYSNGLCECKYA